MCFCVPSASSVIQSIKSMAGLSTQPEFSPSSGAFRSNLEPSYRFPATGYPGNGWLPVTGDQSVRNRRSRNNSSMHLLLHLLVACHKSCQCNGWIHSYQRPNLQSSRVHDRTVIRVSQVSVLCSFCKIIGNPSVASFFLFTLLQATLDHIFLCTSEGIWKFLGCLIIYCRRHDISPGVVGSITYVIRLGLVMPP